MRVEALVDFENYLLVLKERLGGQAEEAQEIIAELETHLRDKAFDLEAQGVESGAARSLAMMHLGDPADICRRMRQVYGYANWQDIVLVVCPHLIMASLFLFELCCNYFVVAVVLAGMTLVSWMNWRSGHPSKWSYSWLGYAVAAPSLAFLISLHGVGYGAWLLITGQGLPVFDPILILLIGCSPLAVWNVAKISHEMVKRDWLWVTFASLPLPVLGSWVLFFHSHEVYLGVHLEMLGQMDYTHIGIFVALGLISAFYMKVGRRAMRVSVLLCSAVALGYISSVSMPAGLNVSNMAMVFAAYSALFAAPVLWKALMNRFSATQGALP